MPLAEVTIIPTYDTDVLGYWVAENEELLAELRIDLAPSASRCTINLQVSSLITDIYRCRWRCIQCLLKRQSVHKLMQMLYFQQYLVTFSEYFKLQSRAKLSLL